MTLVELLLSFVVVELAGVLGLLQLKLMQGDRHSALLYDLRELGFLANGLDSKYRRQEGHEGPPPVPPVPSSAPYPPLPGPWNRP